METMNNYKHMLKMENKHLLRCEDKHKNKDEQRSRKKDDYNKKKARVMVGASDVDSSSDYSTSRSSSNDDDRDKNKMAPKNLISLSFFAQDNSFCSMAQSTSSKKSQKEDSKSGSKDDVRDELSFLRQENEELVALLYSRDDMLREAKKMSKELRASLDDARDKVAKLEPKNLDAKLEIDSLKAALVLSDEVDCGDCSIFMVYLTKLKEKNASKCEELDELRVELNELKYRPALLGGCTSCHVLHGKLVESHSRIVSLEAELKSPIDTSCSTCELHAVKTLEVAHYVDRL
jgi:hypothetical protein